MSKLVELNAENHATLSIADFSATEFAMHQHMMQIRVNEVPNMASDFPIFFSYQPQSKQTVISALTSILPNQNAFEVNGDWDATYMTMGMRTHPIYLMHSDNEQGYTFGVHEGANALNQDKGQALFDGNGKASIFLNQIKTLLKDSIQADIQTNMFVEHLLELKLINGINLVVKDKSGQSQTIQGLQTINEDRLKQLSDSEIYSLHSKGYLAPIYALLSSLYQLNKLLKKHNAKFSEQPLENISLALPSL